LITFREETVLTMKKNCFKYFERNLQLSLKLEALICIRSFVILLKR